MKTIKHLWPQIIEWENLYQAYMKARLGKQSRPEVALFTFNLETELRNLQYELNDQRYCPSAYRQYQIYDRKPRTISIAPFRDRVLQRAVMRILEPHIDKRMIYDSYACRKNKGVHAAINRLQSYMLRYPYFLKLDIASYFASIDHAILKQKLAAMIGDPKLLFLLSLIIDSSPENQNLIPFFNGDDLIDAMRARGLPIGNLTSQFFGNLYLNDVDHYVKDELGSKAYIRYVDDIILLADSKAKLWQTLNVLREKFTAERLHIHQTKCFVQPSRAGVEFLGYRIWPHYRRLRSDNAFQFRRRLKSMAKAYQRENIEFSDIQSRVSSWLGHAQHGETEKLRAIIFSEVSFKKGNRSIEQSCAGWFMEQQPREPAFGQPQQEQHR